MTALSFINGMKYPPSLLYALVTLGASMLLFLVLNKLAASLQKFLLAIGGISLFTHVSELSIAQRAGMRGRYHAHSVTDTSQELSV